MSLCVDDADLQRTALEIAEDLAHGAQSAIRLTKYSLSNRLRLNGPLFDTSTALEMLGFAVPKRAKDWPLISKREGLASHLEKKKV